MKTVHAVWEKKNIGLDAYEITVSGSDTAEALKEADAACAAAGAEYIVIKTPVNCPQFLFSLREMDYTFVETVFHVMIRRDAYHMPDIIARFDRGLTVVKQTEQAELERIFALIRKGVFISDRVSIDPMIGPKAGGNRYANWLSSMIANGSDCYEVHLKDKPIGFFVISRKDEHTVDPVLMGLYDEQNDRGMGALLHKKTLDTCFTYDCDRLTSTIVSNNAKVFSVYLNAGADITETQYTYIKHINR